MTEYNFDTLCDFGNLYRAYEAAAKGRTWKDSVCKYLANALECTLYLQGQLRMGTYKLGAYRHHTVWEPKPRDAMSLPFKDKVVQHSLVDNILMPVFSRHFIKDNYASQKGKGPDLARERLEYFLHSHYRQRGSNEGWILVCDVSKYFYAIDHEILRSQVARLIDDDRIMDLLNMIIDSTDDPGIPIGNQTSQAFALLYLSDMDHFIKERLRIKYYLRYMDDFVLIHEDKEYLKYCLTEIERVIGEHRLRLNGKTQICPMAQGVDIMGFHFYLTESGKVVRKLRHRSKSKMRRKLHKYKRLYQAGRISKERIDASFGAWQSHAAHGQTYHLVRSLQDLYNDIFDEEM